MKIVVARNAGFCWGVERAIERVREAAGDPQRQGQIVMVGPVIHNPQVVDGLRAEGVRLVDSLEQVHQGEHLVIRAHGITPELRDAIQAKSLKPVDGTCPHVGMIQGEVKRYIGRGCHVVVVGTATHPEVVGLLGYCEGRGHVVRTPAEVDALPPDLQRVAVVAQSTETRDRFREMAERVRARYPEVVVVDTLCDVTDKRQQDIPALAEQVDAIVVVGGRHSANTRHLAELVEATGRDCYHIETPEELDAERMAGYGAVGITAGASTPADTVDRVVDRLRDIAEAAASAVPNGARKGSQ